MTDKTLTMKFDGGEVTYPILEGTVGPDVVDIRKLYADTGMFTYDPGFTSTASCQSAITYIDGDQGILLHRGYPSPSWPRSTSWGAFLLLHGDCPAGRAGGLHLHHRATPCARQRATFYRGFGATPTRGGDVRLGRRRSAFSMTRPHHDPLQRRSPRPAIAKMPTIAAMAYKYTMATVP